MCVYTEDNAQLSLSIIFKTIFSWTVDPGDIWSMVIGFWLLVRWSYSDRWFWCERIATIAFPIWRAEPRPNLVSAGCRRFSIRTRLVLSTFDYLEISPQYTKLSLLDIFWHFETKNISTTNCMQHDSLCTQGIGDEMVEDCVPTCHQSERVVVYDVHLPNLLCSKQRNMHRYVSSDPINLKKGGILCSLPSSKKCIAQSLPLHQSK